MWPGRDGQVIGTAKKLVERKFIHRGGRMAHIEEVVVHKDHQRRGIGTTLVRHLTEVARDLDCYKVVLNCFRHVAPFYGRIEYAEQDIGLRLTF